jgi:hypothetical protein
MAKKGDFAGTGSFAIGSKAWFLRCVYFQLDFSHWLKSSSIDVAEMRK